MKKEFFRIKSLEKSRGAVALLTTFLILSILVFIILGLSAIFVNELKLSSLVGRTAAAFYAAESGIEHALYQISKGITNGTGSGTLTNSKAEFSVSWSMTSASSTGRYGNTRRKVVMGFNAASGSGQSGTDCGGSSDTTKTSCWAIKNDVACSSLSSGTFWINPVGTAFMVYCDMVTDGGGWGLAANVNSSGIPPVAETVNPSSNGILSDDKISAMLVAAQDDINNVRVFVDSSTDFIVSLYNNRNTSRGNYTIDYQANGNCSTYDIGPDIASFVSNSRWNFFNGSSGGGIGYYASYGFIINLCSGGDFACSLGYGSGCTLGGLPGALWIK